MKELSLQATLDAGHGAATPSDLCRWISYLAADAAGGTDIVPPRLCSMPSDGELEVWLAETGEGMPEGVVRYSRLRFRPHLAKPAPRYTQPSKWTVEVDLLPVREVYTARPVSRMGLLGVLPQEVVDAGWVLPYHTLTPAQMRQLNSMYAVLTPALASRLRCTLPAAPAHTRRRNPYEALMQRVLRLLPLCFPCGGSADGCPLHLSLQPSDVPDSRLLHIAEEHRLLRFGGSGTDTDARSGICRHGACLPASCRQLRLVMVYPRGELEAACRMFDHFCDLPSLIALQPVGDVDEWVEYDDDEGGYRRINHAVFCLSVSGIPPETRLYCLLLPRRQDGRQGRGASLSIHLRSLVCSLSSFYAGAFPLTVAGTPCMERLMPELAARLLLAVGGMPWMPLHFASQETDLVAGFSFVRVSPQEPLVRAATFYNNPSRGCCCDVCQPDNRFPLFFSKAFNAAYSRFQKEHQQAVPHRLVVYCHCDQAGEALRWVARGVAGLSYVRSVVLVQVRRTTKAQLRHYAPEEPACLPPVGTAVRTADSTWLLFCRNSRCVTDGGAAFYPCPLELVINQVAPDGSLNPLPAGEADGLLTQAFQLVCADTAHTDGSALPVVLAHTDCIARRKLQAWRLEAERGFGS